MVSKPRHLVLGIVAILFGLSAGAAAEQNAAIWVDPSPHRAQLVTVADNVQLEVLDWGGVGRPIVLLAGLGNTAHVFDDFAVKLMDAGDVYGITRRGYGASATPESGYTVDRLGEDVVAVLDRLSLRKVVLIGHSIAGQELSYIASKHPDKIAGLVYLDAGYRYAFHRPGVQEHLRELRMRLDSLETQLAKPPTTPAEMSTAIKTLMGDTLTEFQKDLEELTTTPEPPPAAPRAGPADLQDFAAYRAWTARAQGFSMPEAELRQVRTITPDGGIGPAKVAPAIPQAIMAGSQRFTEIGVPVLALFASPHGLGPWTKDDSANRAAFEAFAHFDERMTERQASAFERGVPRARVVRLPGAGHYLFLTHEREVLAEVRAFLAKVE